MRHSEIGTAQQILLATEMLMAEQGLHALSMQKIAKAAGISVGTIYIYFKNKDELLRELAKYLFARVDELLAKNLDPQAPLFDQYRQMWWNFWNFFNQNPQILKNFYQYTTLPGFNEQVKRYREGHGYWNNFVKLGQKQRIVSHLPTDVLFALGLESAFKLAFRQTHYAEVYSDDVLEAVINKTWQSICN
ncbi:TetR/AcrR family transcriptional regulator [Testudinibacter sp. P80/BLE/0925]|uniref:TetR/AcrR family transcriptional regulator n=1 Tax=Testudinibacter sp. TW-1 TaxID=3417757 RepID=UPI003D35B7F4